MTPCDTSIRPSAGKMRWPATIEVLALLRVGLTVIVQDSFFVALLGALQHCP